MEKKKISISRTARYYQSGLISNKTKNLWFVFHGYGMLAKFFIKKFQYLVDKETVVIAPEATSRFYLDGKYERVGSSWITKVEKEDDIIDNINYINLIYKNIVEKIGHNNFQLNIIGFSQGGPMACRWIMDEDITINSIGFWGSDIPEEYLTESYKEKWGRFKTSIIIGKKDHIIPIEYRIKFKKTVDNYGLNYNLIEYDGDHRVLENILIEYSKTL